MGGGGGSVPRVSDFFFYKESKSKFFEGVGVMAWVSDFFTKNLNKKKTKQNIFSVLSGGMGWGG